MWARVCVVHMKWQKIVNTIPSRQMNGLGVRRTTKNSNTLSEPMSERTMRIYQNLTNIYLIEILAESTGFWNLKEVETITIEFLKLRVILFHYNSISYVKLTRDWQIGQKQSCSNHTESEHYLFV